MNPVHGFDGRFGAGSHCSCGHVRSEHVTRFDPGKPPRVLCRACAEPQSESQDDGRRARRAP